MNRHDFKALLSRYGTQAEVAEALGVSVRTINAACTDETYPRRTLYAYAVMGLLAEAGKPIANKGAST